MKLLISLLFVFSTANTFAAEQPDVKDPSSTATEVNAQNESILQRLYPFYSIYGHQEIKTQVSFKIPLVRKVPLYFGYTQLMFYYFLDHEKLFKDLTYNPQFFYTIATPNWGVAKSLDVGFFDHNSNGKPLPDHRSYNDAYLRMNFEHEGKHKRWTTRGSVQAQYLYSFQTTNEDIQNYIGPLAFKVSFIQLFEGWVDKSEISLQATPGGKFADRWDTGGYQLSWSFRLGGLNIVPAFYLQYYYGYAETLLDYNEKVDVFRGGIIF